MTNLSIGDGRADTSVQLGHLKDKILRTWEARVRSNVPAATEKTPLALHNMLPELLENLVLNLSVTSKRADFDEAGRIGTEHGEQRASLLDYTFSQVLHEYRILRQVIFEVLEEEQLRAPAVRDIILNVLDEGLQKAIQQFSIVRSRELEQSNQDLEHFASIAAHDLKSPLATITGYMEILDEDLKNKIDFEDAEYIRTIKRSSAQMTILIDRILEYSSIGRKVDAFVPISLVEVINRATDNLKEFIENTQAKVTFRDLPLVVGEISLLTQLFQNLVSNAIKFRAETRIPKIEIEAKEESDHWLVSIKDNGIGFNPEGSENLFSLFKTVHSQKSHRGYGIGLATAKKVVALHGGRIWADSQPGLGSTFFFTLAKTQAFTLSLHGPH